VTPWCLHGDGCASEFGRRHLSPAPDTDFYGPFKVRRRDCRGTLALMSHQEIDPGKCGARTRTGGACKRRQLANGRCPNHGGLSSGPRSAAGRARIAAAQKERWRAWREVNPVDAAAPDPTEAVHGARDEVAAVGDRTPP
jgi:hypothetical protein